MTHYFRLALAAFCMLAPLRLATAAPESTSETRPLDARVVRVKIDGVVDLRLRQGSPASLVLSGDPRWVARMTAQQSGDTVVIGSDMQGVRMQRHSPVRAEMVLPNLREVSSESVGTTEITGFRGDELELSLDGAGSMNVNVHYRLISASLGGVGSMKLAGVNSEGINLDLQGAGYVTLSGRSKWLKAELGGLGGLDAQAFAADSVTLELSGLGNATVTAHQSANLNLSGMGSVTVFGKPLSRKVSVDGLGKVSWK
ncbi:GIN domain-containing protein [Massilia niabensis]|uniref:GIN domain-containing protein n=1 Tax=Massilia niabensis TaxID=544910 RepID=A0ABW0L8R8_9BURK